MLDRRVTLFSVLIICAMTIAGFWSLLRLSPGVDVPVHFNSMGKPNGWAPAWFGLLLIPVLSLVLGLVVRRLPEIDPRGQNILRSKQAVRRIWVAVLITLAIAQANIVTHALQVPVAFPVAGHIIVGLLFVIVGNILGKLRWNYTVGIRTPWTLANERVWDQTHRFGGRVFVLSGLLLMVSAFIPALRLVHGPLTLGVTMLVVSLVVLKSYLLWRGQNTGQI